MESFLPTNFNRNTMYSFICDIIHEDNTPKSKEIKLNFTSLRFIKPPGITILHNIIQWLRNQDVEVSFVLGELPKTMGKKNPIRYLDDSGFFEYYRRRLFYNSSARDTTIDLQDVTVER